ncbi:MAG: ABC transporter ATP-binding protein [Spirochaetes bacterium GWF1_31_7]|nr:MAG: ABC transporter ATP-binding protein [Spirochaetes bacterium GWE1_32_154]OHD45311.1 MAG: ABC transporter ATP-binding protein [Spirochaetes bacterium GWE2_31_10]OHD50949.1 MAG: ABC transporter ATP-binding protein [Spirochaetes bacterium GWF1_31_7]OHD78391.1 MAG: ABC transporter ATP-binding protein [Spirochaetes bacterium RIFOXYB1_FULL_32_8]HBD95588.1 ABC transporter ATP-binding protein [Spirochaetia bacterium]
MSENIIEVHNLKKIYPKNIVAVNDISFQVKKGICFGLLGPNGAGKTTTIEMMEGILKPTSGKILFKGELIDKRFKEQVGIQFQNTSIQDFLTVRDTLKLFLSLYLKVKPLDEIIEICSLHDIIDRDTKKLSGGQKQRMLLGIALINDPELLFLDEPTTGLDPQARRNFWELIRNIKKSGKTIILTTHYMDEAEVLCDEIAIMDQGKIIVQEKPEILLKENFCGAFVTIPYHSDYERIVNTLNWNIKIDSNSIQIQCVDIDEVLTILLRNKIPLTGLKIDEPNLEDLFIKLTGSSLRL